MRMSPVDIKDAVIRHCTDIQVAPAVDPAAMLLAIADVESNCGANVRPMLEPSYIRGWERKYLGIDPSGKNGRWFNKAAWEAWDYYSAMSHGPTQIMGAVLWEMDYRHDPTSLSRDADVAIRMTVRYINRRARGAKTLEEVGDAYNSGSFRDRFVPHSYIGKLTRAFKRRLTGIGTL